MGNINSILSKSQSYQGRTIYFPQNAYPGMPICKYPSNRIKTSKYEYWNFLFLNIFYQLGKVANAYFVVLIILMFIVGRWSPISPYTSMIPLVVVITTTMIKQCYEDYLRHKSDNQVNNMPILILKNNEFVKNKWIDIKVGDIIMVKQDQEFPCDMILLSSDNNQGLCHITTTSLDGETNVKKRYSPKETKDKRTADSFKDLHMKIDVDSPDFNLYRFSGKITFSDINHSLISDTNQSGHNTLFKTIPIDINNILLRGAKLVNNHHIYAIVVYTGKDTKMALNLRSKRNKVSVVDKTLNKLILAMIIVLILFVFICLIFRYTIGNFENLWYLGNLIDSVTATDVIIAAISYTSVFNYLIPISLYVSLEVQKVINILFINWDQSMHHEESNISAKANTSDIIEDLGQVEYIFTDKTGTLTENMMVFKNCCINNIRYHEKNGVLREEISGVNAVISQSHEVTEFFKILALCHTVNVEKSSTGRISYLASSTDEKALVEAASRTGVILYEFEDGYMTLSIHGVKERYQLLNTLEFDSTRKRMSVIVKSPTGQILFMCKGAESTVLGNCSSGDREATLDIVNSYSRMGHRTLVVAYKILTQEEYDKIRVRILDAMNDIKDREENLLKLCDDIENNLILLGATAVEDRLQEHVSSTIIAFIRAGIKVWVLTGDKQETAMNISLTCGHITHDMHIFYLTSKGKGEQNILGEVIDNYFEIVNKEPSTKKFALVVDGHALVHILVHHFEKFQIISMRCHAVLCCRMSPLQKANVVRMIRLSKNHPITLAIGDGANDCSMIQEAHVGVGIVGNEGRQAALCSDFCFKKFYFLRQLLLVHGHYFYTRLAYTVVYFFYKNVLFIVPVILYIFHSGFSPVTCYDQTMLTCFNLTFTSLPILMYGVFEKRFEIRRLYESPGLYKALLRNSKMSIRTLFIYLILGIFQGVMCFYFIYIAYNDGNINNSQLRFSLPEFYLFIGHMVVLTAIFQVLIDTKDWNFLTLIAFIMSLLCFPVFYTFTGLIYNQNNSSEFFSSFFSQYFVLFNLYSIPQFWIVCIFTVPFLLLPSLFIQAFNDDTHDITSDASPQPVFSLVSSISDNNDYACT